MRSRNKKWAKPFISEHPELVFTSLDKDLPLFSSSPLYLEIGAGKGAFAIDRVSKLDGKYLAMEVDASVAATLARRVHEEGLENLYVINMDFDVAYEGMPEGIFDAIYLNFPDPWPKKRHEKRRLLTKGRLLKMANLLKKGGLLRFKTDSDNLFAFARENLPLEVFEVDKDEEIYTFDGSSDSMSEYEARFRELGQPIHRLVLRKK